MLGWKIFAHAAKMIFRNFPATFKIFFIPFLAIFGIFISIALLNGAFAGDGSTQSAPSAGSSIAQVTVMVVATVIFLIWGVVSWHRYVLLEEYPPSIVPDFNLGRIGNYLWKSVVLSLVLALILIPLVMISAGLIGAMPLGALFTFALSAFLGGYLMLRFALVLPAAALEKPMRLGESWSATGGFASAIFLVLMCLVALQVLLDASLFLLVDMPGVAAIWEIATSLFVALLHVSILTTMYGVFIEKRELT
ncbi:hypothetical protein [uncultured Ruegeria sp.]|uniref:hypothetical protein n=1 Tax=uncultured Ruegeria sp. TaxID=259304 RepID=UPI002617B323|nr:hypothetical protein [uncultured Ruegeria sp.]